MRKLGLLAAVSGAALAITVNAAYAENPKCGSGPNPNIKVWDITTSSGTAWDTATITGNNVSCNVNEADKRTWPAKSVVKVPPSAYIAPTPRVGPIPQDARVGWSKATMILQLYNLNPRWLQDVEIPVLAKPEDNTDPGKGRDLCGPQLCHALYRSGFDYNENLSVGTWITVQGSQPDGFTFTLNPVESSQPEAIDASLGAVLPMQICGYVQMDKAAKRCNADSSTVNLGNGPPGAFFFDLTVHRRGGSSDDALCRGRWSQPFSGPTPPPGSPILPEPAACSRAPQASLP